ncbi:MAG: hypothetical protein WBZ04_05130 [Candidatus Nanopelagicales bacterium]
MNKKPRNRRRVAVVGAMLITGGLVAGCGPELAGSAAVIGNDRVTDSQLSDQVTVVTTALGIGSSAKANQVVLDRLVRAELYDELAARNGIDVTDGEVTKFLNETAAQVGGQEALNAQLLQSGVPQSEVFGFAQTFLTQKALAEKLAPGKSQQEQGVILGAAVIALSKELDTRVSPRFGTWDAERLSVGAPPNDLSEPLPTENSSLMPDTVQQQNDGTTQGGVQPTQ